MLERVPRSFRRLRCGQMRQTGDPNAPPVEFRRSRRRSPAAPDHQPPGAPQHRVRWCWSGARACTSTTAAGKRYIEGLAGLWCTGLGYGNAELVEAAREQMERLSFSHLFGGRSHEPAIALAEKIKAMSPAPTSKVFFTNSGSEANDTQIKLAWYYNNALRPAEEEEDHLAPARPITAPPSPPPACRASPCSMPTSTCRWPRVLHTDCPHYWQVRRGRRERGGVRHAAWPADLEDMIERGGPGDDRRLHRRAGDGRGRRADSARAPTSRRCRPCWPSTTSPSSPTR